jgi:hypothetical protein
MLEAEGGDDDAGMEVAKGGDARGQAEGEVMQSVVAKRTRGRIAERQHQVVFLRIAPESRLDISDPNVDGP